MLKLTLLYGAILVPALNLSIAMNSAPSQSTRVVGVVSTSAPESLLVEAPIWDPNGGANGYAFLPITIQGKKATVVIDLNCTKCDLQLSTAALTRVGITTPETPLTTELMVGSLAVRDVPVEYDPEPNWSVPGPDSLPPVVGVVGVHFMITHFDILYDFPHRRVRLYALNPKRASSTSTATAWHPPEIKATDCDRRIPTPPGAGAFTGMAMQVDGHSVTGVLEMAAYGDETSRDEKMNQEVFDALQLPATSPRIQSMGLPPGSSWRGKPVKDQVTDVKLTIGQHTFWTGPVKLFPILDVQEVLPPNTPVMLINLTTIKPFLVYVSPSTDRVCISKP